MATGTVLCPVPAAVFSDGSSNNAAPALVRNKGTDADPAKTFLSIDFDPGTDEHCHWSWLMPSDYASGGTFKFVGMINATSGDVIMAAQVSATTPGDADTPLEHAKSTAATATVSANATEANRLVNGSITLNMDSAAAGDKIVLTVFRDANNGSDTATPDFKLTDALFEYTTS